MPSSESSFQHLTNFSLQRDEVRQKKLGKALEWDQDKPALDDDGFRYYSAPKYRCSSHGAAILP